MCSMQKMLVAKQIADMPLYKISREVLTKMQSAEVRIKVHQTNKAMIHLLKRIGLVPLMILI